MSVRSRLLKPRPFADGALELWKHGLAVIPLEGKKPPIKWGHIKNPPGPGFIKKMSEEHPHANLGIMTGLSNLTVVDIDAPHLLQPMIDRCGDPLIIIRTPSGGFHLYGLASD